MKDYFLYFIVVNYVAFIAFVLYMRYFYNPKFDYVVVKGFYRRDDGLVVTNVPKHEEFRARPVTVKINIKDADYTLTYGIMSPYHKVTSDMTGEHLLNTSKCDLFLLKTHMFLKRYFFA